MPIPVVDITYLQDLKRYEPTSEFLQERRGFYRLPIGPELWKVCDKCNYNNHICMFCGNDLTHAEDDNRMTHLRDCRPDLFEDEFHAD